MQVDEGMDLVTLLFVILLGFGVCIYCMNSMFDSLHSYMRADKTSPVSMESNEPTPPTTTVKDILLMLVVADEYQTGTKAIQVDAGAIVTMDQDYLNNMGSRLARLYNEQLGGVRDKTITSIKYELEGTVPRWVYSTVN